MHVKFIYIYGSFPCHCLPNDSKNILSLQLFPVDYSVCSALLYLETI